MRRNASADPLPSDQVSWSARDGDAVRRGQEFGTLSGSARSILVAERIALNFMQRMSGIATATRQMVQVGAARGPDGGSRDVCQVRIRV